MPYQIEIEKLEDELKDLGEKIGETLKPELESNKLHGLRSAFIFNRYLDVVNSLDWFISEKTIELSDHANDILCMMKDKITEVKNLYQLQRENDDGYKDPISHMNALVAAGHDTPRNFSLRYDISPGVEKCLWLTSPDFEESFIRNRIKAAIERNGSRAGHYILTRRRYQITEEQAKDLVNDIWDNPNTVSEVFHKLLDREKLIECRISEDARNEVREAQIRYRV